MRPALRPGCWARRVSLGQDQGEGRLPRRQGRDRSSSRSCSRRRRAGAAELGGGAVGRPARQVGAEPDADQRLDPQVRPRRPPAGRRHPGGPRVGSVEVGGVAAVRGAVGGTHEGMDGRRLVRPGPAGDPDRRHPHRGRPDAAGRRRHRRHRRQASARRDRGGQRERRRGPGAARQPGRPRPRSRGLPTVHHRRRQGAVEGDSQHLRPRHPDPALPGPQGPQHRRAPAQVLAGRRPQGAASGLGTGRRRQGREADPQPRTSPGARRPGRVGQHPGGPRRDPHRHPPRSAGRTTPVARLHQHHREHERNRPPGLPQRQTLAGRGHGAALDRRCHARGRQGFPPPQGPQATPEPAPSPGGPPGQERDQPRP